MDRTPQWHAVYIPTLAEDSDEDDDKGRSRALTVKGKGGKKPGKKLLAIANGPADDSDGSMPELQSVSDSSASDDDDDESDDDASNDDDNGEDDSDDGYDTDEEDELREMMREAMNAAMENPDFFDPKADLKEFESFNKVAEERKGNPFLKLLGSLRGARIDFY